jgi:phenylalanyl-tRNA synthetase beta chain
MDNLIGAHIPDEKVDAILKALEIETVSNDGNTRSLLVPTYRVDVQRPCDVVEDVLRIYGYNNIEIPVELHASLAYKTKTDAADDLRRTVAEQLTAAGFNEILNNSLTAEGYYADLQQYPASHCVKLLNPLSQDLNVMRQTLLFGGLESLAHNINRKNKDLALYETGNVYFLNPEVASTTEKPLAPYSESARLALWMTGDVRRANWAHAAEESSFFHLKANVANVLARLGITDREIAVTRGDNELFAACLNIATKSGKQLGVMGVVAKALAHKCDIKQEVYFAELNWNELVKLALKKKVTFTDLPKTQAVKRDLALLINTNVTMADVEAVVRDSERKLLRSVELFDVYEGDKLPEGKKSYAISLSLQDDEKTLNDKAIDAVMQKIITNLTKRLGAELR